MGGRMNQLVQIAGSLIAILALAWIAARLRLGGDRRIADDAEAGRLADEAVDGFVPRDIAIDRDRTRALLRDDAGRVLLLRRHGGHFAGRLLDPAAEILLAGDSVSVVPADRRFGPAELRFDAVPPDWLAAIARGRS